MFTILCGPETLGEYADLVEAIERAKPLWVHYSHQVRVVGDDQTQAWPEAGSYAFEQAAKERLR